MKAGRKTLTTRNGDRRLLARARRRPLCGDAVWGAPTAPLPSERRSRSQRARYPEEAVAGGLGLAVERVCQAWPGPTLRHAHSTLRLVWNVKHQQLAAFAAHFAVGHNNLRASPKGAGTWNKDCKEQGSLFVSFAPNGRVGLGKHVVATVPTAWLRRRDAMLGLAWPGPGAAAAGRCCAAVQQPPARRGYWRAW